MSITVRTLIAVNHTTRYVRNLKTFDRTVSDRSRYSPGLPSGDPASNKGSLHRTLARRTPPAQTSCSTAESLSASPP
ncbi:hypothetical protein C8Q78DRAFT_1054035 [Trametes maxima]|nr:hypothetical protein C8Q78DRAFT_1054035 [Trametes maxima]